MGIRGSTTFEIGAAANNAAAGVPPLYIPAILIQLAVFVTAGYHWRLRFYPTDVLSPRGDGRFSVSLQLMSTGATVRAVQELTVLDHAALVPPRLLSAAPPRYFAYEYGGYGDQSRHFSSAGMDLDRTSLLEQCTAYVRDGRLLLQFTVTVCPEDPGQTPGAVARIDVPPSDMLGQLGEVLERGEGSDITFLVDGELFPAHRIILAMRSSVFRAELYGEMKENGAAATVAIGDMRPDAFRALLRYIYTDASPADIISSNSNKDEGDDDGSEAEDDDEVWELLTAADRYDVERLKLICERVLCKRLDVENVADTLALADQRHCDTLKDPCIEFMTTSCRMRQVAATQGYMQLKSSHPYLLFEVLEKSSKFRVNVMKV